MELKTVIITQARTGSSRLPNKVLLKAGNKTFLQIHAERLKKVTNADEVIIATTINDEDIRIVQEAEKLQTKCTRGSEQDVLARFYETAKNSGADIVVRVTSDCPFTDPALISEMISYFQTHNYDYVSNTFEYTYPDGIDVEVMSFAALKIAFNEASLLSDREHVTPFIRKNSNVLNGDLFKAYSYKNAVPLLQNSRLTLDEVADLDVLTALIEKLGTDKPWQHYHEYLVKNPTLSKLNNFIPTNEGYNRSLKQDETHN